MVVARAGIRAAALAGLGIVIGLVSGSARAQTWSRSLSAAPAITQIHAAALRPDGSIAVGGRIGDDAWLALLDASGAPVWQRSYGDDLAGGSVVDVDAQPDGTIVAIAKRVVTRTPTVAYETWVLRVDGAGTAVFVGAQRGLPIALDVGDDGSFFVLATYDRRLSLVRCYLDGVPAWERVLLDVATPSAVGDVRALPDSGFAVLGLAQQGTLAPQPWIARCDATGAVLWQTLLYAAGSEPVAIASAPDGSLVVLGGDRSSSREAWLLRLGDDGSILSHRRASMGADHVAAGLAVRADGSVFVVGTSASDGASLLRLEADGRSTWLRTYADGPFGETHGWSTERACAIVSAPQGVVLAGSLALLRSPEVGLGLVAAVDDAGNPGGCLLGGALPAFDVDVPAIPVPSWLRFEDAGTILPEPRAVRDTGARATPECAEACVADHQEPDDDCASARPVLGNSETIAGNFCNDVDDWLRIDACAGDLLSLETDLLGSAADTEIELFDSDCATLLASDDDSGTARGSKLVHVASDGGRVFLHVRQKDGVPGPDTGYRLRIEGGHPASPTWLERFGPVLPVAATTAAARSTGGFVIAGADAGSVWAAAASANGAPDWCTRWQDGASARTEVVVAAAADGGALVASRRFESSFATQLVRVDPTGSHAWEREMPGLASGLPTPGVAVELEDGSFLVGGRVASVPETGTDGWLARLDATGSVTWDRLLRNQRFTRVTSLASHSDGGAYLGASAGETQTPGTLIVARLARTGDLAWSRDLVSMHGWSGDAVVAALPDGGVAIAAPESDGATSVVVARFDAQGSLIWQTAMRVGVATQVRALHARADGSLVVAITDALSDAAADGVATFVRFEADGRLAWARAVRETAATSSEALGVQHLPDGDLLLALGFRDPIPMTTTPQAVLARLDSTGHLTWPCRSVADLRPAHAAADFTFMLGRSTLAPRTGSATFDVAVDDLVLPVALIAGCRCECSAGLPGEVSSPSTDEPLRIASDGTMTWEVGAASGSCSFNVYRGDLARLPFGDWGTCIQTDVPVDRTVDLQRPGPGEAWFYLVSGNSELGEGSLGLTSLGQPRVPSSPCP